jgi:hypothetical protein
MDNAALGRLRQAIAAEDGDEEEQQLNGVLRMLGAEIPDKNQLPLFGKPAAGQEPKP